MKKNTVIIGAGHSAGQAVASLRQKKYGGKITLIGEEPHFPYQRPPLSKKFLAGELPVERLYLKPPSFYDEPNTVTLLNTRVVRIDTDANAVSDSDGNACQYDDLIIATGSRPRRLDVPGSDLPGVHYLRNIADAQAIQDGMDTGTRLVIVGGGYIGLEVAAIAASKGLQVTVVEMAERVMSRVVSPQVSAFYESEHRRHGVTLMLSTGLDGFSKHGNDLQVVLSNALPIGADLVLIGIGVIPNVELAGDAGIQVDNGIRVDSCCRTSVANVYAIGDCTNHPNELLGMRLRLESVHNALEQAKTAASNICGDTVHYSDVPWFWSDQYDLKLQIAGISEGFDQTVIRGNPEDRAFSCLYLKEGRLIAIDSINSPRDFMQSKALIADQVTIGESALANTSVALNELR